jgi:hypothetical protein
MAFYSFRKDFEDSKKGVQVAANYFSRKYKASVRELPKIEQGHGDFEVEAGKDICEHFFVEVKFDLMAAKTGNLCFEVDNGKKLTGIFSTHADKVVYVVPSDKTFKLYVFGTTSLVSYLKDPANSSKIKFRRGGDRGRFGMLLIAINEIEQLGLCEEIVEYKELIDAKL